MRQSQSKVGRARLVALVVLALASGAWAAPEYKILRAFGQGEDGVGPWGGLILDAKRNAYGTTRAGGAYNYGTVFELMPRPGGRWKAAIIQDFTEDGQAGVFPEAGLALDPDGNLYGTTTSSVSGFGRVFELAPDPNGWTITVLLDEGGPFNLILDHAGNLYGPLGHGQYSGGAISELVKDQNWAEDWLYSFCPKGWPCVDGTQPFAGVTWGPDGALYGTTVEGGNHGYGVVFQLTPQQDGTWKETVVHSFPAFKKDGSKPYEGVVLDGAGNVYGATAQGGSSTNCGVIFKLAPQANGRWKETILYGFPKLSQGCTANTLAFDAKGNLWGTAQGGTSGNGVVFELTPQQNGKWKYQVVHQFNWKDGSMPGAAVVFDDKGNLYGTTILGGAPNYGGVAFEITP